MTVAAPILTKGHNMRTASPQAMAIVKSTAPMLEKHDVEITKMGPGLSEQGLAKLIPEFYARVRADPVLGPIFEDAIDDWDEHLEKLQAFWSSIMLVSGRYKGQPMVAQAFNPIRIEAQRRYAARYCSFTIQLGLK